MFQFKIIYILFFIFKSIIYINCDNNMRIRKIYPGSINVIWLNNTRYLYYIDIKNYYIGEENVVEFILDFMNIIPYASITFQTTNQTEEQIKDGLIIPQYEDNEKSNNVRKRLSSGLYVYGHVFKKTSNDQTFHIISFVPKNIYKSINIQISFSNRIKNFTIAENNITNNSIIKQDLEVSRTVENYYKFIFKDISVKEQNILIFVKEFNIAGFYDGEINMLNFHGNRLYIIEKNSTNKLDHIIYLSIIGEVQKITIEITSLKNDIIFKNERNFLPFYIENIKYNEDLFIIENYDKYNSNINIEFDLNIIPLYGYYTLTYYNTYNTINLTNLFDYSNSTIIDKKINIVSGTSNFYRLSCSSPCALKFGYIHIRNNVSVLKEGYSVVKYIEKTQNNDPKLDIEIKDRTKKYYLFFELYGDEENFQPYNYINIYFPKSLEKLSIDKRNDFNYKIIYNNDTKINFETRNTRALIKFYLTSNLLYDNLVEGINIINLSSTNLVFKMRRDILYDYVLIDIYSHDIKYNVTVLYDVYILSSKKITDNGKVLCESPISGEISKKEIKLKYSNPYNKYNNKIKENEHMYIAFYLTSKNKKEAFPLYINIKLYYNNSAIIIPYKEPKIIKIDEEYKIVPDNEYNKKHNLILNINKCKLDNHYSFYTFYENLNNIIWKEDVIDKRNIFIHNNTYNNTKIKINEINEKGDSNFNKKQINSIKSTNYLINDDIYMNYFTINESLVDFKITNDFNIKYEINRGKLNIQWSPYIYHIHGIEDLITQYDIYIFPEDSKVNSICQMSLIPPNYTVFNTNNYKLDMTQGKYKLNIIARVINEKLPLITFYDVLEFQVSLRVDILIIIFSSFSFGIIIIFLIIFYLCKNNKKKQRLSRNSLWISLVEQRDSTNSKKNDKNKKKKKISLFDEDDEFYIFKDDILEDE